MSANQNPSPGTSVDLQAVRERLSREQGPAYWRSLRQLAESREFRSLLQREFPQQASEWIEALSRRKFLQLAGASMALAGLTACTRQPLEKIVPYVRQPEVLLPGQPLYFATATCLEGFATGVLVESHLGRPSKIEGNPEHPASLGATDALAQASILDLYDPDRSQVVTHLGRIRTWSAFLQELEATLKAQLPLAGTGIRILTETVTSPTLTYLLELLLERFPQAAWHQWEPAGRDNVRLGARQAFGEWAETRYDLTRAKVILTLDSDILTSGPGHVRYAHDFANGRRVRDGAGEMNRLYAVESTPTNTGTLADHRLAVPAAQIPLLTAVLAEEVGLGVAAPAEGLGERAREWIAAVARDLQRHPGATLVTAGRSLPTAAHTLVHAINHQLGNQGTTVLHSDPVEARPVHQLESLRTLVEDMEAGKVDTLLVVGSNPVFTAPADFDMPAALSKVRLRVHLGLYADETAEYCHWHIPQAHALESWGDARAHDGTVTLLQPLIEPLYGGKTSLELMAALLGRANAAADELVQEYWRKQADWQDFEGTWRRSLHDGVVAGTTLPHRPRSIRSQALSQAAAEIDALSPPRGSLHLTLQPDPTIHDGRFANNGWLQELPKPLTRLTWDNALLVGPATAEQLQLADEDMVDLEVQGRSIRVPVWILPGQARDTATLHFGYGRSRCGRVGTAAGFNAYSIRTSQGLWTQTDVKLRRTSERYALACTQDHSSMEGRHLVREGTLERYREHPEFVHEMGHTPSAELSLYPGFDYEGYSWGMAVDLSACTGCSACVVACQAENNIPLVGKEQVLMGREMHWLRLDRYFAGDLDEPSVHNQPVMCMHCEQAPCEPVCPVAATVHSDEGLNDMVYNRCVGTRYCSNNCPYKVRRFNFLKYADTETPVLELLRNPDVTVRTRGVMEKCTYCVQRINYARGEAKKADRQIFDGEVKTACQQVCPTEAILFGNLNDSESRVAKAKARPLSYGLLEELNTRPRTTYLAKLRNPNPELEDF